MSEILPSGPELPPEGAPLLHGVDWAVRSGLAEEVMNRTRARVRNRRRQRMIAASSIAIATLAIGLWFSRGERSQAPSGHSATAVVNIPERRTLSDGSVVDLKDGAMISVSFSPKVRRVALLSGEAHFKVAKNKDRPFVVAVGDLEVRAVGTAFSVQLGKDRLDVLVTEGRVALEKAPLPSPDAPANSPAQAAGVRTIALLEAGNRASIEISDSKDAAHSLSVFAVSAAEVSQRLAWRVPKLEFTQTPLSEVIRMINEHGHARISIEDSTLEDVRISGLLRADHIDPLLHLLETEHGIEARHLPNGDIVLAKKK